MDLSALLIRQAYHDAVVAMDIALANLDSIFHKANFNRNQPRVPAGHPDGGQWTDGRTILIGGSNEDRLKPAPHSWARPETLKDHFNRHKEHFSATSPTDYAKRAQDFLKNGQKEKLPSVVDSDGVIWCMTRNQIRLVLTILMVQPVYFINLRMVFRIIKIGCGKLLRVAAV